MILLPTTNGGKTLTAPAGAAIKVDRYEIQYYCLIVVIKVVRGCKHNSVMTAIVIIITFIILIIIIIIIRSSNSSSSSRSNSSSSLWKFSLRKAA